MNIQLEVPDDFLRTMKETPEQFSHTVLMAAACKLYELGKISTGRAAEMVGVPRVQFLLEMGRYGVEAFALDEEELEAS
ncbi:MAG: UPF0175 family protein [Vulcanimicrobiota bacterium]